MKKNTAPTFLSFATLRLNLARAQYSKMFAVVALLATPLFVQKMAAQQTPAAQATAPAAKPEDTEIWEPIPAVVTPGATCGAPPSDAIILFDGKNLDEWVSAQDHTPAQWTVADGTMKVSKAKGVGNIETKRSFKNYQLHVEWKIPASIEGTGQGRGNSGIFLASTGPGDAGYELQVLDAYNNKTYVNGMAGSLYKQAIPLANPALPARPMGDLRHRLDRADLQRRRNGEDSGFCNGLLQWRTG